MSSRARCVSTSGSSAEGQRTLAGCRSSPGGTMSRSLLRLSPSTAIQRLSAYRRSIGGGGRVADQQRSERRGGALMNVDELGPEEFRVAFTQEEHATFDERAPEREVMLPLSRMTPMQVFAAYRRAEVDHDA